MNKKENFVAYDYKNISVKRDSIPVYTDCMSNFGWELIDELAHSFHGAIPNVSPIDINAYVPAHSDKTDGLDMVTLKFKRDRRINNKLELDRLERKCEEALSVIKGLENKKNAYTMGTALGIGIVGTAFIGLSVYNFIFSNIALGVLFTAIGIVGWGIGFLANHSVGAKKSAQAEPMIQEQLNIAYNICEQAHALLA